MPMEKEITIANENGSWETYSIRKWENRKRYQAFCEKEIRANIPGKIVNIFPEAKTGYNVTVGTRLLELEAMKMINTVVAPINGKIKEIRVKLGDEVGKNELLISFD